MKRKQQIILQALTNGIIDSNLTVIGVMDFDGLKSTVAAVYSAFPDNFHHTFAVKANSLVSVLQQLHLGGMGAEVASPGELMIALEAGFKADEIIYDSPTKTINDLRVCIENGIAINIDNLQELGRIDRLVSKKPDTQSIIGFRINPQTGAGKISSTSTATTTSKFGFALADGNNREAIINIYKQRPWLKSIHTHSGSQGCTLDLMVKGVSVITELAEEINAQSGFQQIVKIDIGGGLPVNFSSNEITPTFKEYASALKEEVPILFASKYQVKTEFGRAIVAKNGFIITRVEYTKNSGGRHIVATHAGAQVATRTTFLPKSWPIRVTGYSKEGLELTAATSKVIATDIGGPCCFAGDLISVNQQLPELSPNDYVLVHDTGGYYFTNHFDYNCLPRVAVFAVNGLDENVEIISIRKAETIEDIINKMQP